MVLIIKREVNIRRIMIQISLIKGIINKIVEILKINNNKKKKATKNNRLKPLRMKEISHRKNNGQKKILNLKNLVG